MASSTISAASASELGSALTVDSRAPARIAKDPRFAAMATNATSVGLVSAGVCVNTAGRATLAGIVVVARFAITGGSNTSVRNALVAKFALIAADACTAAYALDRTSAFTVASVSSARCVLGTAFVHTAEGNKGASIAERWPRHD